MAGNVPVSILHEFCVKKKWPLPVYKFIDSPTDSFVCRVNVKGIEAEGMGRSKKNAKHAAAANAIKIMQKEYKIVDESLKSDLNDEESNGIAIRDMISTLRNYCFQHDHPMPIIEIVEEGGQQHAPTFLALCKVASIQRTAVSITKKEAKQKAAAAMYNVIQQHDSNNLEDLGKLSSDPTILDVEYERYQKIKTYRELTQNASNQKPEIALLEGHNYFRNFHHSLKQKAKAVLEATYADKQQQVIDLCKALKLTATISSPKDHMISVNIDCDYDAYFIDLESNIYTNILDYFRDMLD